MKRKRDQLDVLTPDGKPFVSTAGPYLRDGRTVYKLRDGVNGFFATVSAETAGGISEEEAESIAKLFRASPELCAWARKMKMWLTGQIERDLKQAETCRFESLKSSYLADANNYGKMLAQLEPILKSIDE